MEHGATLAEDFSGRRRPTVAQRGLGAGCDQCAGELGVVANHAGGIGGKPNIEFKAVAAVSQGEVKCGKSIFRGVAARPAMSEQERPGMSLRKLRGGRHEKPAYARGKDLQPCVLIEVEVADLWRVRRLFGLLHGLLELLLQQIGLVLLRVHRLAEDGLATAIL